MIPVKICGITSTGDGILAARLGASAIGLIFYEGSPRYVSPQTAREIARVLPRRTPKVGVFVNSEVDMIHRTADYVGLNLVQLHGSESPEFCRLITLPVIKALRVGGTFSLERYKDYSVHAFLLDTYRPGAFGGTGETFDWSVPGQLEAEIPIILSGGLNPGNLLQAIGKVQPDGVDINSGVESSPGTKDLEKLEGVFHALEGTGEYPAIFDISGGRSH